MTTRKVSKAEVLRDIRSGMDETAIGKKYGLSPEQLNMLYERFSRAGLLGHNLRPAPRKLNLTEILADIRKGISDSDLMEKYGLSAQMLRQVSKKLLDARETRSAEDGPSTVIEEPAEFLSTREFVRHEVDFELLVYEASRPEIQGMVRDVSEEGLSVAGLQAKVGELKTLVVLGDELGEFSSFELDGYCRWCVADAGDGNSLTGFSISKISDSDFSELQKLLRLIIVGG